MGRNLGRVVNKIMLGVALTTSAPLPAKAQTTETQEQTEQKKYWEIIKKAKEGGNFNIDELREAIEKTAADAKGGRYLDFGSNTYRSNADDVYGVFYSAWKNSGLRKEVRVEFLRGMAFVDPNKAALEVERAIGDKDKVIVIGAMDVAIYTNTRGAAKKILGRIFDEDKAIVSQAYKSLYMMSSTPDALPDVMNREGNVEKIKTYLDIVVNYYLINSDPRMKNILLTGLKNENREDILTYIVRSIERTDILQSQEARKTALERLLEKQYPELMGELLVESVKKGGLSPAEVNTMIEKINKEYESANGKTRGVMCRVLSELYIARGGELPVKTFFDRINSSQSDAEKIGAIKGLGRLLERTTDENTRKSYLRVLLDIYKNEDEKVMVRNAAAEALGKNAFDECVGVFITQLENSKDVELREGTAEALYLYNEKEPLTYHVSGIEGVTVKEIKRITEKEGKGSGRVLNYLLRIGGKGRYVKESESGSAPNEYTSPNLGIDKGEIKKKPTKSVVPQEIKDMSKENEEIKKAYSGLMEYYGWLAKANLLTEGEADTLVSQVNSIYAHAKEKKDYELMKKVAFLCSALGTNYNKTALAGIVAGIIDENYTKNPDLVVYVLRILRADLVKSSDGKIKGGLATDKQILDVLEEIAGTPSTPDAKGERDHIMMLLYKLIIGLNSKMIKMQTEPEWPWEERYTVRVNQDVFFKGVEPLPDRIA